MAFVQRYGNWVSEDGWRMVDQAECEWSTIPGTNVSIQLRKGVPTTLLVSFLAQFNKRIEPLRDADTAGWTPTNSVPTSNHMAGTACDANWSSHPFHARNTFGDKLSELRKLLDEYDGAIWWGGDWQSPIDEMHFQLNWPEGDPRYDAVIAKLPNHPKPLPAKGLTTETLSQAMGSSLTLDRYAELLPAVKAALLQCDCTTLNRISMWMAQIGTESGGLQWMEEIADGSAYEGRVDLGNIKPGDGRKFKGRGPIQVTGRANYGALSAWAFGRGLVPTVTFFLDNPEELSSDTYGFLGVVWYWTVARNMNSYADAGDIVGATRAVNGGLHGLDDRTSRWNRCLAMGFDALSVTGTAPGGGFMDALTPAEQHEVLDLLRQESKYLRDSRSPLRRLGEHNVDTILGLEWNTDANVHVLVVYLLATLGHPPTLDLLHEVAGADPVVYPDRQQDAWLARQILLLLEKPAVANTVVVTAPVVAQEVPAPTVQPLNASPTPTGGSLRDDFSTLHTQLRSLADALGEMSSVYLGKK